jgi:hypothetical protein
MDIEANIEYGEAVFTLLKRKAENQLELIAPAHDEHVVEFWRALLDMQTVQAKLDRERHRLTVLRGSCCPKLTNRRCSTARICKRALAR